MKDQCNHKYDDIINLPHPTSKKHPRMSLYARAEHSDAVQDWCQILVDILAKYDLKIIDKTEYLSSGRREDEIKDWLDKCEEKIEGFVILDDGAYEWHRHGFDKHLVKTDFCTGGLREEDADKAIKILNKKRLFSFFKKY